MDLPRASIPSPAEGPLGIETQQTSTVRSGGVSETATESVTHTLEQENYGVARMNDEKETCVDTESGAQAGNSTWVRPSQDVRWLD